MNNDPKQLEAIDLVAWRDRLLRYYIGDDEQRIAEWKRSTKMSLQVQIDYLQKMLA